MTKVTIIADNYTDRAELIAEHGFSAIIETFNSRILFDSGQGKAILNNLRVLGLENKQVDKIILSHGHYDHTKGLTDALKDGVTLGKDLYFHENIFEKHLRKTENNEYEYIGIDSDKCSLIKYYNLYENKDFCHIGENLYLSGSVPRYVDFHADERLHADISGKVAKDFFRDEQFLIIDDIEGLAVFTGCSHCGIINIIEHTKKLFPDKTISAVVGGFHLFRASKEQIKQTIDYLKKCDIQSIYTGHCTGMEASVQLKMSMPENVHILKVGMVFNV